MGVPHVPESLPTGKTSFPERSLLPWRSLAFPPDWAAQFAAPTSASLPLHLEVGFGDGRYTVRRALAAPEERFVGLEISSVSVQRAVAKVRREGLQNVKLLKVGATFAVRHLFAPGALSSITVNFPDPWPKDRHAKNRLLQRSFFSLAASRLRPGGEIRLATDHPEYLAFARAEGAASGLYRLSEPEVPAAVFETKYALKWRGQGKPLHYQVFTYEGTPTPAYPPLERPHTMPHALLSGPLPETPSFSKQVLPYGDGHVILHEVARRVGNAETAEKWLVRVTVDEPDMRQQLLAVVKRRSGDELIVRLESFGDPIITKTVRGAVHAVTEWLLSQSAELSVKERNY